MEELMKKDHTANRLFFGILFFAALFLCMVPAASNAQTEPAETEERSADELMLENLVLLLGGKACVILDSGTMICGVIRKVRGGLVHIGHIQAKEYNDVLVRVSDISAIGARFRAVKKE